MLGGITEDMKGEVIWSPYLKISTRNIINVLFKQINMEGNSFMKNKRSPYMEQ